MPCLLPRPRSTGPSPAPGTPSPVPGLVPGRGSRAAFAPLGGFSDALMRTRTKRRFRSAARPRQMPDQPR